MNAGVADGTLLAAVECPHCHYEDTAPLRVSVTTASRAAKQVIPPQFLRVYPNCNALLILTFSPASERTRGAA